MSTDLSARVLYVEDQKEVQQVMAKMLEFLGFTVQCADNGRQGVDMARQWLPDIILMDIRMPVMDGIQATRLLRESPETAGIPVLILSAYTDATTRKDATAAGATRFIEKPIPVEKLVKIIQSHLSPPAHRSKPGSGSPA